MFHLCLIFNKHTALTSRRAGSSVVVLLLNVAAPVRGRGCDSALERHILPWARCEQADSVKLLESLSHIARDRLRRDRHL